MKYVHDFQVFFHSFFSFLFLFFFSVICSERKCENTILLRYRLDQYTSIEFYIVISLNNEMICARFLSLLEFFHSLFFSFFFFFFACSQRNN